MLLYSLSLSDSLLIHIHTHIHWLRAQAGNMMQNPASLCTSENNAALTEEETEGHTDLLKHCSFLVCPWDDPVRACDGLLLV